MKLSEILALTKAGFKASEIREMMVNEPTPELTLEEPTPELTPEEPTPELTPEEPTPELTPEELTPEELTLDYKSLYEKSQEALNKALQANVNRNIDTLNHKTDEDIINDIIKDFV